METTDSVIWTTDTPLETDSSYELEINIPLFVILGVIALLIIVNNVFTIHVITWTSSLRNVTGYLMVSLAVADLGVGITTAIPLIYACFTDTLTPVACDIMGFLSSVCWVVSVYTLTLLSVDRFIAISRPLHYDQLVTTNRSAVAITLVWLYGIILWIFPLAGVGAYKFNDEEATCYFNVGKYGVQWVIYMVVIFVPTSIAIGISYGKIWKITREQRKQINEAMAEQGSDEHQNNHKALRTFIIIIGAFYLAWTPFIIEHIVKAILGKLEYIPEWLEISIYVLAVTNSFWNPLIYISTNKVFRQATKKLLNTMCPCCSKQNQVELITTSAKHNIQEANC